MAGTVRHFAIHTDDTERAMAFYGAVFGWTFEAWGPPGFYQIVGAGLPGAMHRRQTPLTGEGLRAFEVTVGVTLTAKLKEKTVFLVELVQAGLFQIRNIPEQDIPPLLGIACPNTLFPYLRESVSSLTSRAGFTPVILAPMNFEGLYQQRMQQLAQQERAGKSN